MQQGVQNASNGGSSRQNINDSARQINNSNRQGLIMQNFRNLFAGYSASSRNQSRPSRPPPAKRQKSGFYVPKETWTHEFFCLADCAAESAPSRSEKFELQLAGLGRKKIVFGCRDNAVQVKEKLEQAYPKLDKGGGFEILRSGNSTSVRGLCVLKPPTSTGYSVNFLRNESGLGQALAYIRPLQRSLDTSPSEESGVQDSHHVGDNIPQVECVKCKVMMPVTAIKQHMLACPADDLHDIPLEVPSTSSQESDAVAELSALFPDKSIDTIRAILADSGGDKSVAASRLIQWSAGTCALMNSGDSGNEYCTEEDSDLMQSPFEAHVSSSTVSTCTDPVAQYKQETLDENGPPLRIYVNRMTEEFTADVLSIYKKANPCFRSNLRVQFENERAVGEGPVREFFSILMGFVQNGLYVDDPGRLTMLFEGQTDHKIPVPNALLCNSGLYTSVGRMIAHSFLHGGPPLYGLSPAVLEFWTRESISEAVTMEDIPDYDLRQALKQLSSLDKDEEPSDALKEFLLPYRDEASVLQVPLRERNGTWFSSR
ncbi:unnamed protein product [Porites lobata]|uniref:Uncharacterized protein n=1 Tax=Porites lobata TaxID=104759 RepID=A0ABN8PN13_9CNID|nr:unnamed protein product [Porites lobata]